MGREENVAVFQNTKELCEQNARLIEAVRQSTRLQKLFVEDCQFPEVDKKIYDGEAQIIVSKKRTYEAASAYRDLKVCVLNFASSTNPGGGVVRGANAQEECLCRCSNLYFALNTPEMWDGFYNPHRKARNPIHNDDVIYTPKIVVFKTDTAKPELMPENEWYQVNVITCAAPNLRERPSNSYNSGDGDRAARVSDDELLAIHEKRFRRILDVAAMEGNEVIVLGAFGCGAFMNDPKVVAQAAKNVIKEYRNAFKVIEFAIYCGRRGETNYRAFQEILML